MSKFAQIIKMKYPPDYWSQAYVEGNKPGWDIGYPSTPVREYVDQLSDKDLKILIPGAGNGYEVEYLFNNGFKNVFYMDFAEKAISNFTKRVPGFPPGQILRSDFFEHSGKYNLIIEQTFFSSLPKELRKNYVKKTSELLELNGKLVGLLFNHEFEHPHPPFGGSELEYTELFRKCFNFMHFETSYNSIKPRAGREIFMVLIKKICYETE